MNVRLAGLFFAFRSVRRSFFVKDMSMKAKEDVKKKIGCGVEKEFVHVWSWSGS